MCQALYMNYLICFFLTFYKVDSIMIPYFLGKESEFQRELKRCSKPQNQSVTEQGFSPGNLLECKYAGCTADIRDLC